jgi:hypothetical protein
MTGGSAGGLHMLGGDLAGLFQGRTGQCVVGQTIDLARHAPGGLEQCLHGGRFEQRQLAAGQAQPMDEVVGQLLAGQSGHVMAHHDALGERFVHRHAQAPAQLREPDQQQAEAVFRIHLVVGEQTQILEHLVAR